MKIVINTRHSGFSLCREICNKLDIPIPYYPENEDFGIDSINPHAYRAHPTLIKAIEDWGEQFAGGHMAELEIIEIPDDVNWVIEEHAGKEHIAEVHRRWS